MHNAGSTIDGSDWALVPLLLSLSVVVLEFIAKLAIISVILIRERGRPSARLTWMVVILAVPLIGIVLYLLVGEVRLGVRRTARLREIVRRIEASQLEYATRRQRAAVVPGAYRQLATLAESVGHNWVRPGNQLELIGDTDNFLEHLIQDIDRAECHCHLLFYIFLCDAAGRRVADALIRATRRGIPCRLLVDSVGSKTFARSPLRRDLERAGVVVVEALPANALRMLLARVDLRNHRKLVVIDGSIGYVGSQNIAEAAFAPKPKFAPWVDAMVRVMGPVAHDLQILFVEDWYLDTNVSLERLLAIHPLRQDHGVPAQLMGTGPSSYNEAALQLINSAIHSAQAEVIMTTPYFVPDEATSAAIRTAARRGVETTLVVPARNDSWLVGAASRSFYGLLLEAGVHIYEFQEGLLHAKTITLDRNVALVGSANLDRRSFELNLEAGVVVYDSDFASRLRLLQRGYIGHSRPVSAAAWERRGWPVKLMQNAAGTLSPLL